MERLFFRKLRGDCGITKIWTSKRKRNREYERKLKKRIGKKRYIPLEVRDFVKERDKGKCVYCRKKEVKGRKKTLFHKAVKPVKLQFGHKIAFSKDGDNCVDNIQLECRACNLDNGTGTKAAGLFNVRGVKGCKKRHVRPK